MPVSASSLEQLVSQPASKRTELPLRVNNFDLIRLLAAGQVVALHAIEHLNAESLRPLANVLWYFPGVPIFFVISGYLISMSWDRAPSLRQYLWNRLLRIYPALWVCLLVSIAFFLIAGVRPAVSEFIPWLVAQITIVQFYNPDFLRSFGTGVLNGSLWTITVELQFYFVLPLLALIVRKWHVKWWIMTIVALGVMLAARSFMGEQETFEQKMMGVTIIPYLFFFLIGIIARQLHERVPQMFAGKGLLWFAAYIVWLVIELQLGMPGAGGNQLNAVSIVILGFATVALAFTARTMSGRILHGNDISYGVYIYHMPIVNLLLFAGVTASIGVAAAVAGTIAAALLSWHVVEKPALKLKGYSARW